MVFSSPIFLFVFLPAVLGLYYLQYALAGNRFRNAVLLFFSYVFYLYGAADFVLILTGSVLADYLLALVIERGGRPRRAAMAASLILNLGILGYFKYWNLAMYESNRIRDWLGEPALAWSWVALPIGISFFTFQKLSYMIDVYRGERKALRSLVDLFLYVLLFPQMIAGPIVRYHEVAEQLRGRVESLSLLHRGVLRFIWGLGKKALLANACGEVADSIFGLPAGQLSTAIAWLGTVAYTLQIYMDFSAYSDMAIGLGWMFGFHFPENFNRPYSAVSVTDFWRRWHITLSSWFRDYLYLPLGGNRRGTARTYLNLLIVFALCGLWHGARGSFLLWGLYHGAFLIIERVLGLRRREDAHFPRLRRVLTLLVVMVGWVLFRAEGMPNAIGMLGAMFGGFSAVVPEVLRPVLNARNLAFMAVASVALFLPAGFRGADWMLSWRTPTRRWVRATAAILVLLYASALIASGSYNPFIYFRF